MPELPEVECLTRHVRQVGLGKTIESVKFFRRDLREPIPEARIHRTIVGKAISEVTRRSKYLLVHCSGDVVVFHLGMSGKILGFDSSEPRLPHTHAVFGISASPQPLYLHYIDPRRFGIINCFDCAEIASHRYFAKLGPEPLATPRLGEHLFKGSRHRQSPIKSFLMDAAQVVGVGNIYANEALFRSAIHPLTACGDIDKATYQNLARDIKNTLRQAIEAGGTSFRDFLNPSGNPGYFQQSLLVYGRQGCPCKTCQEPIDAIRLNNRATYFCSRCQVRS